MCITHILLLVIAVIIVNKLVKISFALGTLLVILLAGFVGLAYLFEDEIVEGVQLKINQQLETKVDVGAVNFSMLARFPYASIKFDDVFIENKDIEGDTLLFAQELYLSFNMMDLVSKNYTIKKAEINDGKIHMHRNESGSSNYIFWHESEEKGSTVNFDIEELKLQSMDYTYLLGDDKFELNGFVEDLILSGAIDGNGLALNSRSILDLRSLEYDGKVYIENQHTKLEGGIQLDKSYNNLSFNDFSLSFGEIELPIEGRIFNEETFWNLDLSTNNKTKLKKIMSVLSEEIRNDMDSYSINGQIAYDAKLQGAIKEGDVPILKLNYLVEDGTVKEKSSGVSLKNIHFKGGYQNLQKGSERLTIDALRGELAGGNINVSGAIENFDSPWLNLSLNSSFNLGDFQQFLKIEDIDELKGDIVVNTKFKGPFPTKELSRAKLDKLKMSGDMSITDLQLRLKDNNQFFEKLNGGLEFDDSDLKIHNLTGQVNGSEFVAEGNLKGFMQYVFDKQDKLNLTAKISSKHLDLDALLSGGESDGEAKFSLDNNFNFNLDATIDRLTYKNFVAEEIYGKVKIQEGLLQADNIRFNSSEGAVKGDIKISNGAKDEFIIISSTNVDHIDISRVFDEFDQFGQEFIQAKHLMGNCRCQSHI